MEIGSLQSERERQQYQGAPGGVSVDQQGNHQEQERVSHQPEQAPGGPHPNQHRVRHHTVQIDQDQASYGHLGKEAEQSQHPGKHQ